MKASDFSRAFLNSFSLFFDMGKSIRRCTDLLKFFEDTQECRFHDVIVPVNTVSKNQNLLERDKINFWPSLRRANVILG